MTMSEFADDEDIDPAASRLKDFDPVVGRLKLQISHVIASDDVEHLVHRLEHRWDYHRPSFTERDPEGWLTEFD